MAHHEYDKAMSMVDKALLIHPLHAPALNLKGAILMLQKDFTRALGCFLDVPEWQLDVYTFIGRVECCLELQSPVEASDHVRDALERIPNSPELHTLAGRVFLAMGHGHYTAARQALDRAIDLDKYSLHAHVELSRLYEFTGDVDKGIVQLEKMLRSFNKSDELHARLGYMYLKHDQVERGVHHLTTALDLNPQNEFATYWLNWHENGAQEETQEVEQTSGMTSIGGNEWTQDNVFLDN
jgi:tetratricopeptide (TPR) repeat protein